MNTIETTASLELSTKNRQSLWAAANQLLRHLSFMEDKYDEYAYPFIGKHSVDVTMDGEQGDWYIIKLSSDGELVLGELAMTFSCCCRTSRRCQDPTCLTISRNWNRFIRIQNVYDEKELRSLVVHPADGFGLSTGEHRTMHEIKAELRFEELDD